MTRLQTLRTLLECEQKRRDEARAGMRAAQRSLDAARQQADALADYRGEYCKRWSAQFAQGGAIELVRCYQGFIDRLDHAIGHQGQVVRAATAGLDRAGLQLQQREIRVATVERLIQRHAQTLARAADRREQKALDEMAQRRRPGLAAMGMA